MKWFISDLPNFVAVVRGQRPYQVQVVQMSANEITIPEIINKIHNIVLNYQKVKVREIAESVTISNWACGQYFTYTFVHEKALCKMGAAIAHD